MNQQPFDLVGVGFGPANLALAVALFEQRPIPKTTFIEQSEGFAWHRGMLLEGTSVQNSFMKDLVSLRNPQSEFSFTSYLKHHNRLHQFINLDEPHPTRFEFNDYFRWVAGHFQEQVAYGWQVSSITPCTSAAGTIAEVEVTAKNARGESRRYRTANLVLASGGQPNMLAGTVPQNRNVIHSSEFLFRINELIPVKDQPVRIAIVGGGQSGAEIVDYVLKRHPGASVNWIISGPTPRPADDSPFVNDIFLATEVDQHYADLDESYESDYHRELRNSNYSVIDTSLLYTLYRRQYADSVRGQPRLSIAARKRLARVEVESDGTLGIYCADETKVTADCLILATGYCRQVLPPFAAELETMLELDDNGNPIVEREYRLRTTADVTASVYVQGLAERTHGLGETLFPIMPFRSARIAEQVSTDVRTRRTNLYPPARHHEVRNDRLYEVIRRYPFGTLMSQHGGRLDASSIPMILSESNGGKATLFGHLDAENPQANFLEDRELLAIFHGPNTYISPQCYHSDQLPTWNYVSVHVRGVARIIHDYEELKAGLQSIPVHVQPQPDAYRLSADDPRIPQLIGGIVGFTLEIQEIEGRFKLSQDRSPDDREQAREVLANSTHEEEHFVRWLHDEAETTS